MGSEVERWLSQNAIALFLQGVGAQQGLNKGAPIACIWCFLKLSSVICAPPAFLRFERKRLTEIAHDRWHIIAQNVLLLIFISNASIISLNTDNVCVAGKWDKRTGHNAPLRPRWDFLIVFFVWSKSRTEIVFGDFWLIDYLLPIVVWLVCVTCYTFQPINYNAVANLFRVHCVGWWWLTCLYPICGFDIYIGAILASFCICNWVWSTLDHHWRDLSTFAREMASSWRIRKWNQSMQTVAYTIQERVFACRMSNAG